MPNKTDLPSLYSNEILQKNLSALFEKNKPLFERICLPVDGSHVTFDNQNTLYYYTPGSISPFKISTEEINTEVKIQHLNCLLLFGIGSGELLWKIISNFPNTKIVVWDRDPWLMRLVLMKYDFVSLILKNRVEFYLGIDLIRHLDKLRTYSRIIQPYFGDIYANELQILNNGMLSKKALVCNGGLFVQDVSGELMENGYTVYIFDHSSLSMEEINILFDSYKPDLVFSINYVEGLTEFCETRKTRLICWEIDPSTSFVKKCGVNTTFTHVYTYRKKNINDFLNAGISAGYLPLAANTKRRVPSHIPDTEAKRYLCDLSFVGVSMLNQATVLKTEFIEYYGAYINKKGNWQEEGNNVFDRIIDEQKQDFSCFTVAEIMRRNFPDFMRAHENGRQSGQDIVMLVGEYAAALKRLYYISNLGKFGIRVWGDDGWKNIEKYGVVYAGEAGHKFEINNIYSYSLINIDINRIYQNDIVTMRVFDALACGGFVLTGHSDEVQELFEVGKELDTYRTIDELIEKVAYYINHKEEAKAIAQKGRERVLKNHNVSQRVKEMLGPVKKDDTER